MDAKKFLKTVADYNVVNHSLCKRLFPQSSLKEIKEFVRENEKRGLIQRRDYTGFSCFTLTGAGFKALGIDHVPKLEPAKGRDVRACFVNHLRHGITEEIKGYANISLERWVSGGRFASNPLSVKVKKEEQTLRPEGLAILKHKEIYRLYFIHYWRGVEQVKSDLFLYFVYQAAGNHIKRFFLSDKTALRVLCLLPNLKEEEDSLNFVDGIEKVLQKSKGVGLTLFAHMSKVRLDNPLGSEQPLINTRRNKNYFCKNLLIIFP